MNQEVPQPATATRSPRAGSSVATWPSTWLASRAARRQQPGCDATSASVRPAPAALTSCSPTPSPFRSAICRSVFSEARPAAESNAAFVLSAASSCPPASHSSAPQCHAVSSLPGVT